MLSKLSIFIHMSVNWLIHWLLHYFLNNKIALFSEFGPEIRTVNIYWNYVTLIFSIEFFWNQTNSKLGMKIGLAILSERFQFHNLREKKLIIKSKTTSQWINKQTTNKLGNFHLRFTDTWQRNEMMICVHMV